jgi:hypothetical protein
MGNQGRVPKWTVIQPVNFTILLVLFRYWKFL